MSLGIISTLQDAHIRDVRALRKTNEGNEYAFSMADAVGSLYPAANASDSLLCHLKK